jgi:hypothetical protein
MSTVRTDEEAILYYKKKIELSEENKDEMYLNHYFIGHYYQKKNNHTNALFHWLEAYNNRPTHMESLYEIIKYYRIVGQYNRAYYFYLIADKERKKKISMVDISQYLLDFELSIIGYYVTDNPYNMKHICMKMITYPTIPCSYYNAILSNYKFYTDSLLDISTTSIHSDNITLLRTIGKNIVLCHSMVPSSPSISQGSNDNELIICVRYVNYKIDEKGNYINYTVNNKTNIITINVLAIIDISFPIWTIKNQSILDYDKTCDDFYIGIEDIRILRRMINNEISFSYSSNRCIHGSMQVEYGIIDIQSSTCIHSRHMSFCDSKEIEKNWVLFYDCKKGEKCVYGWYPLIIGIIHPNGVFDPIIKKDNVPAFFKSLRGSTNGIVIEDEIWFICHMVSYEDRRNYYHIMVVLDRNTYELISYTPFWTFQKIKVEYTLGMVFINNHFLIGYSTMDNMANYTFISKNVFDDMMIKEQNNHTL